jgi:hypothetical protein
MTSNPPSSQSFSQSLGATAAGGSVLASSLSAQRDDDCRSREVHLSHGDRAFESASSTAESANPWSLVRSDPTRGSRQALNLTPASVRPARSQLSASWRLAQSVDPDIACRPLRSERAAPTSGISRPWCRCVTALASTLSPSCGGSAELRWPVILHRTPYGITAADAPDETDITKGCLTKGCLPSPEEPLRGSILRGWRNCSLVSKTRERQLQFRDAQSAR